MTEINITPQVKVYIDKTKKLTINDTEKMDFLHHDKSILTYGFSPDFNVWLEFTLENCDEKNAKEYILEYEDAQSTEVIFYDGDRISPNGLFHYPKVDKHLTPIFRIKLRPAEKRLFYLKASSTTLPLIIGLNLSTPEYFYKKEVEHRSTLSLFFGAMGVLFVYNLFIYFFTRDRSYLYYVIYLFGMILHHGLYSGVLLKHLPHYMVKPLAVDSIFVVIYIFVAAFLFFVRTFLQISKYKKLDKIFDLYLVFMFAVVLLSISGIFRGYESLLFITIAPYIIAVTIYIALKERSRQAYYVIAGWCSVITSFVLLVFQSCGLCNIGNYFDYLIEAGILLEAVIFSIALADRINMLQRETLKLDKELLEHKEREGERLKIEVERKTLKLKNALEDKKLLFKELHHRVKNNLQVVISLLRLQGDRSKEPKIKEAMYLAELRINAMSHLHELLYKQDHVAHIDTERYILAVVSEIAKAHGKSVEIVYEISVELKMERAVYVGIILSELVINAFKYAFEESGKILIKLEKSDEKNILAIEDDGCGFDVSEIGETFGIKLVGMLTKRELGGDMQIDSSSEGTTIKIAWRD